MLIMPTTAEGYAEYRRQCGTDSIDGDEAAPVRAPVGAEHGDSVNQAHAEPD